MNNHDARRGYEPATVVKMVIIFGLYYDPMVKIIFINGLYYKPMVKINFTNGTIQTGGENALGENDFFCSDIIPHFVCASMMC